MVEILHKTLRFKFLTVDKITKEVDTLDSIRTMSDFSPTSLDLTRPFHTSNWVAFIFWIMVIMAIALTWSIVRNFQWYKKLVEPGCCKLWSLLKAVLSMDLCRKKKPIERAFSSFWDIGEPPVARDNRQDLREDSEVQVIVIKQNKKVSTTGIIAQLTQNSVAVKGIRQLNREEIHQL